MATVTVRYEPDRAEWDRIALSPEILRACLAEANKGKRYAQTISPVDTGAYRSSFHVVPVTVRFRRGPRAAAILYNDDPAAAALEFGNRNRRPHRVLSRTAQFLGS